MPRFSSLAHEERRPGAAAHLAAPSARELESQSALLASANYHDAVQVGPFAISGDDVRVEAATERKT